MPYLPKYQKKKNKKRWSRNDDHAFYNSAAWRKFSKAYKVDNPFCVECGKLAEVTDHIVPINDGGGKWDWDNLQSLCKSCNGRKTVNQRYGKK